MVKTHRRNTFGESNNTMHPQHILNYFKQLSAHIGPDYKGKSILLNVYERLGPLDKRSVLYKYLTKEVIERKESKDIPIFPFGVNLSQQEAVKKAMENSVSIIEGPPGTGKTQTILNIIANIVSKGQSVAVVSGNNSATSNVQEKLDSYGFNFITSQLGSSANKKMFFENNQVEIPDTKTWGLNGKEAKEKVILLRRISDDIQVLLGDQRKSAKLKEELSKLQVEQKYFENNFKGEYIGTESYSIYKNWSKVRIVKFMTHLEITNPLSKNNGLWFKLNQFFRYGIYKNKLITDQHVAIINSIKRKYYIVNIDSRKREIEEIEKKLTNKSYQSMMEKYSQVSLQLFKAALNKRYSKNGNRKRKYTVVNYKRQFSNFIKDYPVVLSTTNSILSSIPSDYLFDYVIIDEASQVDLVTAALALSCCKNIVVVGDVKQLPHIVSSNEKGLCEEYFSRYPINEEFTFSKYSIIESLMELYGNRMPTTLLSEHYRCHPKIIGFCNEKYYDNQLVIMTEENEKNFPLSIYKTAPGNHARRINHGAEQGWLNARQIELVRDEILYPNKQKYGDCTNVGIISPYRYHANETKRIINFPALEVDTVHKFQGREKKTIIFTTVSNEINPFIDDANLINVAVSRAVNELKIVTSDRLFKQQGSHLGDLIRYVEYNSFSNIKESKKVSVFDLLYSDYSKALLKYRHLPKQVSDYKSENLMYSVIEEVLAVPEYKMFKCVLHIPLHTIIKDFSNLTGDERKFVENPWSHVDFLIFNKLDKEPILAIEVDGFNYHRNNEKQLKRDELKNNIFAKNNLPLLRIATNESGEKEKLSKMLERIVGVQSTSNS